VALLDGLLESSGGDVAFGESLIPAHGTLGELYALQGRLDLAIEQSREALNHATELLALEGNNRLWLGRTAKARLNLADYLFKANRSEEATAELQSACSSAASLVARNRTVSDWTALRRDCLATQTNFAIRMGQGDRALTTIEQAVKLARSVKSSDGISDQYGVARAYRLTGDAYRLLGNASAAMSAWKRALEALPSASAERPSEMIERQLILTRVGRAAEASQLATRLSAMGYRAETRTS